MIVLVATLVSLQTRAPVVEARASSLNECATEADASGPSEHAVEADASTSSENVTD